MTVNNPAGKIAEKSVWRSVFLTIWHCILNVDSTKIHSSSVTFQWFCRLGRYFIAWSIQRIKFTFADYQEQVGTGIRPFRVPLQEFVQILMLPPLLFCLLHFYNQLFELHSFGSISESNKKNGHLLNPYRTKKQHKSR